MEFTTKTEGEGEGDSQLTSPIMSSAGGNLTAIVSNQVFLDSSSFLPSRDATRAFSALSQDERDALLATLVFVDKPKVFDLTELDCQDVLQAKIVNYSTLYARQTEEVQACLVNPTLLRTGDVISWIEYGRTWAVWLRADLISSEFDLEIEEDNMVPFQDSATATSSTFSVEMPVLAPRSAPGTHSDGEYHCYLFAQPDDDDMGDEAAAAVSSAPHDYYWSTDYQVLMNLVDPLLTHSKSDFGKLIQQSKQTARWRDDATFPLEYVGVYDGRDGEFDLSLFEWQRVADSFCFDHGKVREMFSQHFLYLGGGGDYVLK